MSSGGRKRSSWSVREDGLMTPREANADLLAEITARRDGDHLRLVAHHGPIPVHPELPLIRGISNGRAVLSGQTVHVADMQTVGGAGLCRRPRRTSAAGRRSSPATHPLIHSNCFTGGS